MMIGEAKFDATEREASDHIIDAMNIIKSWGLEANHGELEAAIHVVQGFIIARMLTRANPDEFNSWYG